MSLTMDAIKGALTKCNKNMGKYNVVSGMYAWHWIESFGFGDKELETPRGVWLEIREYVTTGCIEYCYYLPGCDDVEKYYSTFAGL